jgi:hypothetical protein
VKPFAVFKAPDNLRWLSRPQGKNRYRVEMWVELESGEKDKVDLCPKQSCTITDLMPLLQQSLDDLHQGKSVVDYGFNAYVWG